MVHFMLLHAKQPLESRLCRFSVGLGHHFRQELRRQRFHPSCKLLPLGSQQFEDLGFGSGLGFLGVEPVHHAEKVEPTMVVSGFLCTSTHIRVEIATCVSMRATERTSGAATKPYLDSAMSSAT